MAAPVLSSPSQLIHLEPQGASTHDDVTMESRIDELMPWHWTASKNS
jgi:hypothetical protein